MEFPDFDFYLTIFFWAVIIVSGLQLLLFFMAVAVRLFRTRRRGARAGPAGLRHGCEDSPEVVITLVHGTWARTADWTFAESELCSALTAEVGNILFQRFCWSGRNSMRARRYASWQCALFLWRSVRKYPSAGHFVIAHSHGGTVVLNALRPRLVERLSGVVLLATPVIVTRDRRLDRMSRRLLPFLGVSPLLVSWFVIGSTPLTILSLSWAVAMLASFLRWPEIQRWLDHVLPDVDFEPIPRSKIIFVRAMADEAFSAIVAAHMISWIITKAVTLPIRFYGFGAEELARWKSAIAEHGLIIGGIIAGWFLLWFGIIQLIKWELAVTSDRLYELATIAIAVPLGLAIFWFAIRLLTLAFVYILLPLALLPLFGIAALTGLAIGPEMMIAAIAKEMTVEPCPPGTWRVAVIPDPHSGSDGEENALQHSVVYRSSSALATISLWIKERAPSLL